MDFNLVCDTISMYFFSNQFLPSIQHIFNLVNAAYLPHGIAANILHMFNLIYRKVSNISRTQSENLNASRLIL